MDKHRRAHLQADNRGYFRLYFAAIKNHIMVFGLVFQRITVGTSQKKIGPIKFAVYIAAMGPQMLNFNSVWRGNLTEIALVMKILTELFCDIRLRITAASLLLFYR